MPAEKRKQPSSFAKTSKKAKPAVNDDVPEHMIALYQVHTRTEPASLPQQTEDDEDDQTTTQEPAPPKAYKSLKKANFVASNFARSFFKKSNIEISPKEIKSTSENGLVRVRIEHLTEDGDELLAEAWVERKLRPKTQEELEGKTEEEEEEEEEKDTTAPAKRKIGELYMIHTRVNGKEVTGAGFTKIKKANARARKFVREAVGTSDGDVSQIEERMSGGGVEVWCGDNIKAWVVLEQRNQQ
ncbi:hypothetical protein SAICODRAFT_32031 [Saitoella complicata NRRL Y-17804]|uniref:Uncharacterized protein n=1 Tax=Saitoella complicata (strain BCRC 22490 / CBS 7301 / JCM 7358 / NBRC 10748 / NRRL Y-17804) TaxID=698492 RepID=A0A0E9NKE9_SAICN|nr:uncharacterized protein SAICODRAFT_32031 [Saitoella complicata NRRL Y-17804]ODQ50273.1 hypothetical protein SAICODRAFT_32031 [Saitoella complicata NRRL Y-17804]GAO50171.1 hypothetical protein G7K_4305-t1 [Saitoella complicata NRRL Y-17804]